ncbi:mucin-13 [Agelaius phoeniceus]|uniref:mucin-13 n=1 Tax=Agelaius phoeniceus TaxID=39638 RepID=UPI004055315C
MRRSVFFAVCLGLVLSLLKEAPAETSAGTTVTPSTITTENGADNKRDPKKPVEPNTGSSGNDTDNGTEPDPPVDPNPGPSGNDTDNGTEPDPPVDPNPGPSGNDTDNGTEPDPPVDPNPGPSGNNTDNGTKPDPPVDPNPGPSGNNTDNGTKPDPPVDPNPGPSGNNTDNGTKPDPPVDPNPGPSGNGTDNGTDPKPSVVPSSQPSVDFCHGDPCGRSSATCISLQSNYTCVCEYGYYYSNENCYKGDVYPATIAVNTPYSKNLEIVNSTEYQELSNNVSAFFKEAFKNLSGYVETVIVKIQPLKQSENRNSVPGVSITVTNLFTESSNETENTVSTAITAAVQSDRSFVSSYQAAKHCDVYECNLKTTVCEEKQFPECKCKPDLEKTKWDDRSCSICSANCSAAKHKYCVQEEEGPACKCMINFKKEAGECVACPVGYSGEECSDNSELILIIVGTVFGAIILCLVIAVSVISVRAKHKQNPEKRSLMRSGYSDTSDDRPSMFPRVQTTSGHANPGYQPNNPYEMHSRNRDRFPERDYDDLYEISREPTGFRTRSRY